MRETHETLDAFLIARENADMHMGVVHVDTGIAYDVNAAVDGAMRYASANSSLGAEDVRKLVKAVKMIADPDMEEYLLRMWWWRRKACSV